MAPPAGEPARSPSRRCAATSTTPWPRPGSPTPPAARCATPSTTSAGCSSPTRSCTACRRTSPNSSPATATSTPPWATRPSTPRKSSTATGRSSPAAARCAPARNTAPPPTRNGPSSSATSNAASSPSATAAAPTAPPASTSTAACAARCCAPTPPPRPRLVQIRDNLIARIAEAETHRWLGEAEGLKVSLAGADAKLAQMDQIAAQPRPQRPPRHPHLRRSDARLLRDLLLEGRIPESVDPAGSRCWRPTPWSGSIRTCSTNTPAGCDGWARHLSTPASLSWTSRRCRPRAGSASPPWSCRRPPAPRSMSACARSIGSPRT